MTVPRNYMTVKQVPERYPAFTEASIRWLIFHRAQNGFDTVIRKVGKRILIDEEAFIGWIEKGANSSTTQEDVDGLLDERAAANMIGMK